MWPRSATFHLGVIVLELLVMASLTETSKNKAFDKAFLEFLDENKYSGGAVAAMKDGKLVLTKGYGTNPSGKEVTAHAKFPVSSIAKSLTAVATMLLIQEGKLSLQDKVFGEGGVLKTVRPWRETSVDPGLYDITVDHLLHHAAGWDVTQAPLYDHVFNNLYRKTHENVPNIAADMDLTPPLEADDLISYVISHPLSFAPGTRFAYSNIGYLVLGRVVETISTMEYKDFVKKNILEPCGMWNTRATAPIAEDDNAVNKAKLQSLTDTLEKTSADSALGWYSNAYDLMRLMRCTFQTDDLLNSTHRKLLLAKPELPPAHGTDSWYCSGFLTNGVDVWQSADPHSDDLIIYHHLKLHRGHTRELPDSWVVLLHGQSNTSIIDQTRDLMAKMDSTVSSENLFVHDLSDLHKHPNWQPHTDKNTPEYTIKYKLEEHHVLAYVNAVQNEGLNIIWLTSYTFHQHTFFLIVCKLTAQPTKSQYDYIFEHGMDHRQLLHRKLELEESGYNMTFLHSYRSQSHNNPISFAAIFQPEAFSMDTQMKYGTGHLPEPYEKLVQMYYEKQFYPISQTVVYQEEDEHFSFIFIKDSDTEHIDFKHFYDLTATRLVKLTSENAKNNLHLSYLNSYDIPGKFRLAAVYTNTTDSTGVLEIDQSQNQATEMVISHLQQGLIPKYLVPYIAENSQLKLVIYFDNDQ